MIPLALAAFTVFIAQEPAQPAPDVILVTTTGLDSVGGNVMLERK